MTNGVAASCLPPLFFRGLARLESLSLVKTSLAALPSSMSHLSALRILQLSSNKLTALPSAIGTTPHTLSHSHKSSCLTARSGHLPSLEQLYCSDNLLTSLPPALCRLTSLRILFLDNNRLTALPAELAALACTRRSFTFSVSNNSFDFTQVGTPFRPFPSFSRVKTPLASLALYRQARDNRRQCALVARPVLWSGRRI